MLLSDKNVEIEFRSRPHVGGFEELELQSGIDNLIVLSSFFFSKRKARAIKPNIGTRNILKEISQRNEEFMKMTIDRAKRSWKSEKKQSHSYSIIYSDKEVSPFNVQDLLKNTNPKLSGFVSSFVFYADEHDVYEYLQKKFPDLGVLGRYSC